MKKPVRTFKTLTPEESRKASAANTPKVPVKRMLKREDFRQTDAEIQAERIRKDNQEYTDRLDRLATAKKAENKNVVGDKNWRENLADKTGAIGDKLRVSNKPNFFDDYVNPAAMVGNMASAIGQAPKQAKDSNSVMPYVTSLAAPIVTGALAGMGVKPGGTKLQNLGSQANELFNPLAGTGAVAKEAASKVSKVSKANKDYLTNNFSKEYAEGYMKQAGNKLAPDVQRAYEARNAWVKGAADSMRLSKKAEEAEARRIHTLSLKNEDYVKAQIVNNKTSDSPLSLHSWTKDDIKKSATYQEKKDGMLDHKYFEKEAKDRLEQSKYQLDPNGRLSPNASVKGKVVKSEDGSHKWVNDPPLPKPQSQIEQEKRMAVKTTHPSKRSREDQVESERVTTKLRQIADDNSRKGPSFTGWGGNSSNTMSKGDAYIEKSYDTRHGTSYTAAPKLRKGINMSTTPADSFATKRKYDMGTPSVGGIIPKKNVTVPSGGFDPMSDKAGADKLAGGDLSKPTSKGTGIVSKVAGLAPSASGTIKGIGNLFTTYGTIRGGNSATSEDAIKTGALMGNIGNTVGNIETTSNKAGDTAAEVLPLLMKKGINFKGKTKKMC